MFFIAAGRFVVGSGAQDSGDRFIYNNNTNKLFFDADGTGSTNPIVIATLNNSSIISNGDIEVIG